MKTLSDLLSSRRITRRKWFRTGAVASVAGLTGSTALMGTSPSSRNESGADAKRHRLRDHGHMGTVNDVDHSRNGFDPTDFLTAFDYGETSPLPQGGTLREYTLVATDREVEVAPGVFFPAWTFSGRVPGPTLRCVEGDRLRVRFVNGGSHPHTIHFHGIHGASMDGVPNVGAGLIRPGESTVYEFDALPFGCHLYHCHAIPLKRHIHKGLYGAFIIDPNPDRYDGKDKELARARNHNYEECKAIREMVMVMNGFDTNFDGDNEIYAANTVAFAYMVRHISVLKSERQRLYLVNLTEFDPVNSFHLHGNFFDYYDHGTTLEPTSRMIDTVMQCQGQRGILEFSFDGFESGPYMFHAHQSEFAELGWMGFFDVKDDDAPVT